MPLDALRRAPGGLDAFRIGSPREIAGLLRSLCEAGTPMHLNAPDGRVVTTTLWASDTDRATLSFSIDLADPALGTLQDGDGVVVVGYLDNIKLQFELGDLVLVHGANASVLRARHPREMLRLQRRDAYRVRPLMRAAPTARLRHSAIAEMALALRVLDVSIGGCALFLPDDVPPMAAGTLFGRVQVDLDADTRFDVDLRLQHVTSLNAEARGVRLGCEFVRPDAAALRSLQRFIDQTQKRGRLLAIG